MIPFDKVLERMGKATQYETVTQISKKTKVEQCLK